MKVEIELPEIAGYEYTGESRTPLNGEWFMFEGEALNDRDQTSHYYILRKIPKPEPTLLEPTMAKESSAIKTLESKGYTYHGGEYWKPPLGPIPDYIKNDEAEEEEEEDTQERIICLLQDINATLTDMYQYK